MRRSTLTFRDATGAFYGDRWKPLFEGIMNIILSILLVNFVGVTGVIIATIITNLVICHVVEPYVLYKTAFGLSPQKFYLKNYGMLIVFFIALIGEHLILQSFTNVFAEMMANGCISVVCAVILSAIILLTNKEQGKQLMKILRRR